MISIAGITSIAFFMAAFCMLGIGRVGTDIIATTKNALAVIQDQSSDDEAREKAAQQASVHLLVALFSILLRTLCALLVAAAPILILDRMGWADSGEVVTYLSRWDVILITSATIVSLYIVRRRIRLVK